MTAKSICEKYELKDTNAYAHCENYMSTKTNKGEIITLNQEKEHENTKKCFQSKN